MLRFVENKVVLVFERRKQQNLSGPLPPPDPDALKAASGSKTARGLELVVCFKFLLKNSQSVPLFGPFLRRDFQDKRRISRRTSKVLSSFGSMSKCFKKRYTPEFSPSVRKKDDAHETSEALSLSPPAMRPKKGGDQKENRGKMPVFLIVFSGKNSTPGDVNEDHDELQQPPTG